MDELLRILLAGVVYTGGLGAYIYCNRKSSGVSKGNFTEDAKEKKRMDKVLAFCSNPVNGGTKGYFL